MSGVRREPIDPEPSIYTALHRPISSSPHQRNARTLFGLVVERTERRAMCAQTRGRQIKRITAARARRSTKKSKIDNPWAAPPPPPPPPPTQPSSQSPLAGRPANVVESVRIGERGSPDSRSDSIVVSSAVEQSWRADRRRYANDAQHAVDRSPRSLARRHETIALKRRGNGAGDASRASPLVSRRSVRVVHVVRRCEQPSRVQSDRFRFRLRFVRRCRVRSLFVHKGARHKYAYESKHSVGARSAYAG